MSRFFQYNSGYQEEYNDSYATQPNWELVEEVHNALAIVTNADTWIYDCGDVYYLDDDAEEQVLTEQQLKVVSTLSGVQIDLTKEFIVDYICLD